MSEASFPTQPAKSGSGLKTVLIVVAVVVLLGLLACGGMVGLGFYALYASGQMIKSQVESSQVIQDELGSIDSISMDFQDTARQAEPGSDQPVVSYAVEGPKGSGHLLVVMSKSNSNQIESVTLVTSDKREIPIPLAGESTTLDDADIDAGTLAEPAATEGDTAAQSDADEGSN